MEFPPGHRIGALRIEQELGRGAYGVVYLARDELLGRPVALKTLLSEGGAIPEERREEVLSESRLIGNLKSRHIVTLYRLHETEDGSLFQEMEFVTGGTLEERMEREVEITPEDSVRILHDLAEALRVAHASRVIHGDIKPANVLFGEDGTVKLADFGMARMLKKRTKSRELHGRLVGSPLYMAPEVISGRESRIESDIWSLGVLLHLLLSGKLPFPATTFPDLLRKVTGEDPEPLDAEVPDPVSRLLGRCLSKDPDERPDAEEVLAELERLFEVDVRFLPGDTGRENLTNLTPPPGAFVGRASELGDLTALLKDDSIPLITLLGPGGIGKTRLSQELCLWMTDQLAGGAWFADLAEIRDVDGIALSVANALGVPLEPEKDPVKSVASVLRFRDPLLLVLDNFEQILPHAAATVGSWMQSAPHVRFLATSRARLRLPGEKSYNLQALPTPPVSAGPVAAADLLSFEGVRLFVERAREANADFMLDESTAGDVARIVRELEGLPLAIELAAARARIMKPKRIAENLGRKFQLLKSSRLDVSVRQKTLEGAIDWSFDLLDETEREAFLQASCFFDGFDLKAAENVIALPAEAETVAQKTVADVVLGLKEKSLFTAFDAGPAPRLVMYRAIREYGQKRWRELGEPEQRFALESRHATHYLGLADHWNRLIPGARDLEAVDHLAVELGNLKAVSDRALAAGDIDMAARATLAGARTLRVRRPPSQLLAWVDPVLVSMGTEPSEARVVLLTHLTAARRVSGDWERALSSADEAVAGARELGARSALTQALLESAEMRRNRGDLDEALAVFSEAEKLAEEDGDIHSRARATGGRAMVLGQQGDFNAAFEGFKAAEELARKVPDLQAVALNVGNQGVVYESRAELDTALECHKKAEDVSRRMGNWVRIAVSIGAQGNVLAQAGKTEEALRKYTEAEAIARDMGARQRVSQIVGNRGGVHAMREELDEALACLTEAERIARELGDRKRVAVTLGQRARLLKRQARTLEALECFKDAETLGREMGDLSVVARNLCDRGSCYWEIGSVEEAWTALEEGVRLYDEMHANESVWYFSFKVNLASVAKARGDVEVSRRLAEEGLALAERLGVTTDHPQAKEYEMLKELAG